ncbi:MAG: aminotransferase class I/II-fold pyridoxal phosphate-dependent enzyme [Rhodospirillaceae bacterium]|nr:aminotransferase class I/II-fold pyridoxal phosphate-dependent enzyme [Rhodospirillaceae bacterium]
MALKIANRGVVPPFIVMDVLRDALTLEAAGRSVIHLEVGQPSTGIPKKALAAIGRALNDDILGYTMAGGIPPLRARIAAHYKKTDGIDLDPERVFVTMGSSAAFTLAFITAFEAGDRVALASPGYPAYRHILKSLGIVPELIPVDASTHYAVTPDHLRKMPKLPDGLIVASPANPTGSVIAPAEFKALAGFCHDNGIRLISDEIYHGLSFGPKTTSAAACSPSALVINSFSKYFSMTGWRLGWLVVPPDFLRALECLAQNMFISAPTISQHAGVAVFDCIDELEANVARYARNREILLAKLPEIGFSRFAPADGAFYIYADVSALTDNAMTFCRAMLHEAGVAATPGIDFDPDLGHRFVRFSFAGSTADIEEACVRLKAWRTRNL